MAGRPATQRRKTLIGDHPICSSASMDESYEAGDVIGTGSFGIIRKVKRRPDGMILARKELNYGRMDERDLRQLTEEVNILEQLGSNDNIVRYHERFVDKPNNMLYILMEYCEGGDLAKVIQRCRNTKTYLSEDVVWAYLTQITLALYDCHAEVDANGRRKAVILHRDLKPENVFLDNENNLKLGDFGLSKAMAQAAMTQTYVGTPYYMSPELINGQPYDVKSDIWALGCLIYELCAGHPPFHEARTQPELAVMIREGKIPDLPKPYTSHLGQVVRAMLKQNPKHRPNTAQIKALDNVKLQIRAIELRKATRELRIRDQHVASRESDLLAREAAVLLREKALLGRENSLRAASEAVKQGETRLALARLSFEKEMADADRENQRPGEAEALARVASRPSLVPRRPLDERRSSNSSGLPFPRLSSTSSLMSLDQDTPIKSSAPNSLRRRLASKSMHDLAGPGGFVSTPSRAISSGESSPMSLTKEFGRRSETVTSPTKRSLPPTLDPPKSPSPRPIASLAQQQQQPPGPARARTAPSVLPPSAVPTLASYDDDDVPSPFLKKMDGTRFPSASNLPTKSATVSGRPSGTGPLAAARGTRASLGGKPTMGSRLLAARAQAAAGVDEVGRRISTATAGHLRGKSLAS